MSETKNTDNSNNKDSNNNNNNNVDTSEAMDIVKPGTLERPPTDAVLPDQDNNSSSNNNNTDHKQTDAQLAAANFDPGLYCASHKGAKSWQEDSYWEFKSANGLVRIGGVWDGHGGYNGLVASTSARDQCRAFFQKHSENCEQWTPEEWQNRFRVLFAEMHSSIRQKFLAETGNPNSISKPASNRYLDNLGIVRSMNGDPVHGGTTCSIVVFLRKSRQVITANVGDSTAVLVPAQGQGEISHLTTDHGPESEEEYERLCALDPNEYPVKLLFVYDKTNVYRKYECPSVFLDNKTKDPRYVTNPWGNGLHPTNVRYEPAVYAVTPRSITKDSTCIAMTRALGDFYAHQFGLCCEPSLSVVDLKDDISYSIVVASDGVWDCWKYQDFQNSWNEMLDSKGVQAASQKMINSSIAKAISNFGAKHYDDATLVAWQLPTAAVDNILMSNNNNNNNNNDNDDAMDSKQG